MGAYSSWAAFTLTHHLIVQIAAKDCSKELPFTQYAMLGDDIVIADNEVSIRYRELINLSGVELSSGKSHVSNDTYEFAKR